jgi:peptide/nickel transport system substrate-binding protein
LREGVRGTTQPFTSADVAYTAMQMWKKHLNYGPRCSRSEAVETPTDHRDLHARPMPLAAGRARRLYRAEARLRGQRTENPANTAPIGTGPSVRNTSAVIIAEKNPNYR